MSSWNSMNEDGSKQKHRGFAMHFPRRKRLLKRLIITTLLFVAVRSLQGLLKRAYNLEEAEEHPITTRMRLARSRWLKRVEGQTSSWHEFEQEYRSRYGLEPPPGMYRWWYMAKQASQPLIDEYDEMMESLLPFRQLGGQEVRRRTIEISSLPTFSLLRVDYGRATFHGEGANHENVGPGVFTSRALAGLMDRHIEFIPHDTIFAINEMPEPRIIPPYTNSSFHTIESSLGSNDPTSRNNRRPGDPLVFPGITYEAGETLWDLYAQSCPPETLARRGMNSIRAFGELTAKERLLLENQFDGSHGLSKRSLKQYTEEEPTRTKRRGQTPHFELDLTVQQAAQVHVPSLYRRAMSFPADIKSGLHTAATSPSLEVKALRKGSGLGLAGLGVDAAIPTRADFCNFTTWSQLTGAFYSDVRAVSTLYPVFSPAKMDGFADILVPNEMHAHLNQLAFVKAEERIPWALRIPKLAWRGNAVNGGNNPSRFQLQFARQRFVKMAQNMSSLPIKLLVSILGSTSFHTVQSTANDLNRGWMDVAFDSLDGCGEPTTCDIARSRFLTGESLSIQNISQFKVAVDLDSTGLSSTFTPMLHSGTAVIRSSVYRDYATAWLEPWVHYIPLSLGFHELYNILAYFLPLPGKIESSSSYQQNVADEALRSIALAGLDWSDRVGNVASAELYFYRLALEWARILNSEPPVSGDGRSA